MVTNTAARTKYFLAHVPAQSGAVKRRRGRGGCRVVPVRLGAEEPLGLEELVEVEWGQYWALTVVYKFIS